MRSHPAPAKHYEEAFRLFETLRSQEPQGMNPDCRSRLLAHGKKTGKAIILVHGYTCSPPQFLELGRMFFEKGYNVLIVTLPHHGLAQRMTREHGSLKAEELAAYADRTVDIASGLGSHITIMGLSMGGVITSWAAQQRKEIDLAVIISPAFGFRKIPARLTWPAMVFYRLLPDAFEWWDPELKENGMPPWGYPKYSRHALTELLNIGFIVRDEARKAPPAAKKILLVLNPNDDMVNNAMAEEVASIWKKRGADISTFTFDASLKLPHDLICPEQAGQRTDIVYPRLIELSGK
jgi:carboxylesterase